MRKREWMKKLLSLALCAVMVLGMVPAVQVSAEEAADNRVADTPSLDGWEPYFNNTTEYAGGIWTDKSVMLNDDLFAAGEKNQITRNALGEPETLTMMDEKQNFLVALSALASNKSVKGFSVLPSDTMLVLDVSGSMSNQGGNALQVMVDAANDAIQRLQNLNDNNRVGVVLYSGNSSTNNAASPESAQVLLPLGRYDTDAIEQTANGTTRELYLQLRTKYNDGLEIRLYKHPETGDVQVKKEGTSEYLSQASKTVVGGTYIQNGLDKAWRQFAQASPVVTSGVQAGTKRIPIMVLMSDGAPTVATTSYLPGQGEDMGNSNAGNGDSGRSETAGNAFLTQLTASYIRDLMSDRYNREPLFYTLGLDVDGSANANSVLNPANSTNDINGYWKTFKELDQGGNMIFQTMTGNKDDNNGQWKEVVYEPPVQIDWKQEQTWKQNYVDHYYPAGDAAAMIKAFQSIVDEIVLQSRYYPTLVENNDYDLGGYVTFTDELGKYMEVKDVKGIVIGNTLYSGEVLIETYLNSKSLGTIENPEALGDEFIRAVKSRLGIADTAVAQNLVHDAYQAGQLAKIGSGEQATYSNYIGWYADANGTYLGHWKETDTSVPAGAAYINKCYCMLGETDGSIADSNMLYITIQVHESIETGDQTVIWKIPASLIPMVSYEVTFEGDSYETAEKVKVTKEAASPIRLLYEVGLRSEINPINVLSQVASDYPYRNADGTLTFYTNAWGNGANGTDADKVYSDDTTTVAMFEPSVENERFYYAQNSYLYDPDTNKQVTSDALDPNIAYKHRVYYFDMDRSTIYHHTHGTSAQALQKAAKDGDGYWYIPKGTPHEWQEDTFIRKVDNMTETLFYRDVSDIQHPDEGAAKYYSYHYLGNNGKLTFTPAQGIKLSKSLYGVTDNSSTFTFRITTNDTSAASYTTWDGGSTYGTVAVADGVCEVSLKAGEELYIIGIPVGTGYTVEELQTVGYEIRSASVGGGTVTPTNNAVSFDVTKNQVTDIHFENQPDVDGALMLTKTIVNGLGSSYSVDANEQFSATITFDPTGLNTWESIKKGIEVDGVAAAVDENNQLTVSVKHGQTVHITGLTAGLKYTVTENLTENQQKTYTWLQAQSDAPAGYTGEISSGLSGTIPSTGSAAAKLVNRYVPAPVKLENLQIKVGKQLLGRPWDPMDSSGNLIVDDAYTIAVYPFVNGVVDREHPVETVTITNDGTWDAPVLLDELFPDVVFTGPGRYQFYIGEVMPTGVEPDTNGKIIHQGVAYDQTLHNFEFLVKYNEKTHQLELSVNCSSGMTKETVNGTTTLTAKFINEYTVTGQDSVTIEMNKTMTDRVGAGKNAAGYSMGLYSEAGQLLVSSLPTVLEQDGTGKQTLTLIYLPSHISQTPYGYVLKEVVPEGAEAVDEDGDEVIDYYLHNGMRYSAVEYPVTVTVVDNYMGSVDASITVGTGSTPSGTGTPSFANVYAPAPAEAVITGSKVLENKALTGNDFTFELYNAVLQNGMITHNVNAAATVQNDATGTFTFSGEGENGISDLKFGSIGDYYFAVREQIPAGADATNKLNKVTYDPTVHYVKVSVTDSGEGKLNAEATMVNRDGSAAQSSTLTFTNTYTPDPAGIVLGGVKTMTGREIGEAESFEFALYAADTQGKVLEIQPTGWPKTAVSQRDQDHHFYFEEIHYDVDDAGKTFHYVIKEALPAGATAENGYTVNGITYDTSEIEVAVEVRYDNGTLTTSAVYSDNTKDAGSVTDKAVFVNQYSAKPVSSAALNGVKKLENAILSEKQFSFTLSEAVMENGALVKKTADAKSPVTVQNDGEGKFAFAAIDPEKHDEMLDFTAAGTYYFVVEEVLPDGKTEKDGIHYDTAKIYYQINVTDDGEGALVASAPQIVDASGTPVADGKLEFTNTYRTKPVTEKTIVFTKSMEGRDLKDQEFSFHLYASDASGNINTSISPLHGKNDADGKVSFTISGISTIGTKYYVVEEFIPEGAKNNQDEPNTLDRVTYDPTRYLIKVVASDDGKGQLTAKYEITKLGVGTALEASELKFVNRYKEIPDPDPIRVELDIQKYLRNARKLDGFVFELVDAEGTVVTTAVSGQDGKAKITVPRELTYADAAAGTVYDYVLREKDTGLQNMIYSQREYKIVISAGFDQESESLYAIVTRDSEVMTEENDTFAFTNVYRPPYTPPVTPEKPDEPTPVGPELPEKSEDNLPASPDTGDEGNTLWIAMVAAGILGFAVTVVCAICRRRRTR